jgi:hypothetical protein
MQMKLLDICNVDFNVIDQWPDFYVHQILEKKWEYNGTVHQLCMDFSILIEFVLPMKLVVLIKMCLNEIYSTVHVGKNLSDRFPIQNGLKQGDALS